MPASINLLSVLPTQCRLRTSGTHDCIMELVGANALRRERVLPVAAKGLNGDKSVAVTSVVGTGVGGLPDAFTTVPAASRTMCNLRGSWVGGFANTFSSVPATAWPVN